MTSTGRVCARIMRAGPEALADAFAAGNCYATILQLFRIYDPTRPDEANVQVLTDKPSTAAYIHNKLEDWVVAVIRRVAQRHPDWGGRQIALHLRRLAWTPGWVAQLTAEV